MSLNFPISNNGKISAAFLDLGINDFEGAMNYVRRLPYGRNKNKSDLLTVFTDNCGTCGTKHALLKQLANENDQQEIKLIMGIFKMGDKYSSAVGKVLSGYHIHYIPEAHNYFRVSNQIIDCTTENADPVNFIDELMDEIEINPGQITGFKVSYHQAFLKQWLENEKLPLSFEELWKCREACIAAMSS